MTTTTKPFTEAANKGKVAEKHVQKFLKSYDDRHQQFDWARNYDAHSAGGRFQRQTGDYQFYLPGRHGVLEVKETAHAFRLPHKNYDQSKVAKVYKRTLAGGAAIVLVLHTSTGLWRMPPFEIFRTREGGSWDLTAFPTFASCEQALDSGGVLV